MSQCRTCEYALYDGMCLAKGKFTLLDAPACDDYKRHIDVEVSVLKSENAKLRELIAKYSAAAKYLCGFSHCNECNLDCASVFGDVPSGWDCARMLLDKKARELGGVGQCEST